MALWVCRCTFRPPCVSSWCPGHDVLLKCCATQRYVYLSLQGFCTNAVCCLLSLCLPRSLRIFVCPMRLSTRPPLSPLLSLRPPSVAAVPVVPHSPPLLCAYLSPRGSSHTGLCSDKQTSSSYPLPSTNLHMHTHTRSCTHTHIHTCSLAHTFAHTHTQPGMLCQSIQHNMVPKQRHKACS